MSVSAVRKKVDFEIIDAREIGYENTLDAVERIFKSSFAKEPELNTAQFPPHKYNVKRDYFGEGVDRKAKSFESAEWILLAKVGEEIKGFLVVAKYLDPEYAKRIGISTRVAKALWLAVDPSIKNSGIGSVLMIESMKKAKAAGKTYLSLQFRPHLAPFYEVIGKKIGVEMEYDCQSNGYENLTYNLASLV
jgi:GNAT superfamily N-acetyltransferase